MTQHSTCRPGNFLDGNHFNTFVRNAWLCLAVSLTSLLAGDAQAGGWVNKSPTNLIKIDSGRRNNVFYVGDPVIFTLGGVKPGGRFEVRDYWGNLLDKGEATEKITIKATLPGWYKLYVWGKHPEPKDPVNALLEDKKDDIKKPDSILKAPDTKKAGPTDEEIWGDIVGGTTFCIFRHDTNFPEMPGKEVSGSAGLGDEVVRGVTGMGPQRHHVEAGKPDETFKSLDVDVAIDKKWYLPYDPQRKRSLMAAFSNGTKDLAGVTKIVEHYKNDIEYWEPRNEPNFGSSAADFVEKELKPFYAAVKAVDPKLKVLGPGTVGDWAAVAAVAGRLF